MVVNFSFDIREHLDKLQSAKSKNRYVCPVCNKNNLTVDPKTAKYKCWNGCECKDIREALAPRDKRKTSNYRQQKQKKKPPSPVPIPEGEIVLATLPEKPEHPQINRNPFIPSFFVEQGIPKTATETRYSYSQTQWVSRFEWPDPDNEKGHSKTMRQGHIKSDGSTKWGKGSEVWRPYRIDEVDIYAGGRWILGVEGEKCVEACRGLQLIAITWQGSAWTDADLESGLLQVKQSDVTGIIYIRDNDAEGLKKASAIALAAAKVKLPCLLVEPNEIWQDIREREDIADWIKWATKEGMSADELIKQLEAAIHKAVEQRHSQASASPNDNGDKKDNIPNWSQSDIASWLAERYRPKLAWNIEVKEWFRYSSEIEGIWSKEPEEFVGRLIKTEVESIARRYLEQEELKNYSANFISGIIKLLKYDLAIRTWDETPELLPLLNGVLNLKTYELIPHAPGHRLTWCLPYNYSIAATCEPIQQWLIETVGGDEAQVQMLRAYLNAVVKGRLDLQRYLELVGPGGTGKSTFIRLAMALVGQRNIHTTTLQKLEGSRFETASIHGKRLVVITDSERYAGSVSVLKALTGQDPLPYEVKFVQSTGGFTPTAMVIVAANEVIQSADYTSGLERRRVTVPFKNQIAPLQQRNLIEIRDGKLYGEFLDYIPGLLNWVLAMSDEDVTNYVKRTEQFVPSLAAIKAETIVDCNPIADWADQHLIHVLGHRTQVGIARKEKERESPFTFQCVDTWLYANYCEYSVATGAKPVAVRRFISLLQDLSVSQLKLEGITKGRDRYGSYVEGLKLRSDEDQQPCLITGKQPRSSSLPYSSSLPLQPNCDGIDDICDGTVTAETLAGDKCDGCDSTFQTQLKEISDRNIDELRNEKVINKIEKKPSQPTIHHQQGFESSQQSSQVVEVSSHPLAEQFPIGVKVRKVYEDGDTFEGVVTRYSQPDVVIITNTGGDSEMWRPNSPNLLELIDILPD